jgi:exosome complex component CSL4
VRAKILSLGDTRSYYLTTAANELGVVRAKSPFTGELMVAASWEEMECPTTGQRCKRKVAKIV